MAKNSIRYYLFVLFFSFSFINESLAQGYIEENILRIKADNDLAVSYMLIGHNENASDGFKENMDVRRLFSPLNYIPEVYALADEVPADIRFINNNKREVIVPLGIRTGRTGQIHFTFTGMNNYFKALKIELIDAFESQTVDLTGLSSYTYYFSHLLTGIQNGRFSVRFTNMISVVWTPDGADQQNWHNENNWTPKVVPTASHDVYIPGNLTNYPKLTRVAECRDIYFMQGGELGRPDLLNYRFARIQFNFGLKQSAQRRDNVAIQDLILNNAYTNDRMRYSASVSKPLERERWHLLSAPLKGIVTGDLSFGGYPLTFLRKFYHSKDGIGRWTDTYTSLVEPVAVHPTDGFAFYMYGYDMGPNNRGCEEIGVYGNFGEPSLLRNRRGDFGLGLANGIIELPFFENDSLLHSHRSQSYFSGESTFYFVDSDPDPENFNKFFGTQVSHFRENNKGYYRFAPETLNGTDWVFLSTINHPGTGIGNGSYLMLGNPYMSSIDMAKFLDENSRTLETNEYKLWNGSIFTSYTRLTGANTFTAVENGLEADPNPGFVAPQQGFFVKTLGSYNGIENAATFNVQNISTVRENKSSNLRSNKPEENILRIKAENDIAASYMLIGFREDASNGFQTGRDVQKLFTYITNVPEIYALADEIPTDIRVINNQGTLIVPLGIKTEKKGDITLSLTGMNDYLKATKIEFIDALKNITVNITGMSSYTYTFNHTETGIQNGRFVIRFGNSITSIPKDIDSSDLKVYGNSQGIFVYSSGSNPIHKVSVYDMQGRQIYESTSGANFYPLQGNTGNSLLIVKVITENEVKTVKLNAAFQH